MNRPDHVILDDLASFRALAPPVREDPASMTDWRNDLRTQLHHSFPLLWYFLIACTLISCGKTETTTPPASEGKAKGPFQFAKALEEANISLTDQAPPSAPAAPAAACAEPSVRVPLPPPARPS